jgi:formyltetrahydrofolate hydrolase
MTVAPRTVDIGQSDQYSTDPEGGTFFLRVVSRLFGADIGGTVLPRAVKWHCEDRVPVSGDTTVVF